MYSCPSKVQAVTLNGLILTAFLKYKTDLA